MVYRVKRAVAVAFLEGFDSGVAELRKLPPQEVIGYLPYHAALGSLAERSGDVEAARSAYTVALNLSQTPADRGFFTDRLATLD